jgi:hypothetical protein
MVSRWKVLDFEDVDMKLNYIVSLSGIINASYIKTSLYILMKDISSR